MTSLADDPLASMMRSVGMDVTREDYIDMAWCNEVPEPWTVEHELELPDELQDLSKLLPDDDGEPEDEEEATAAQDDSKVSPRGWTIPPFPAR